MYTMLYVKYISIKKERTETQGLGRWGASSLPLWVVVTMNH